MAKALDFLQDHYIALCCWTQKWPHAHILVLMVVLNRADIYPVSEPAPHKEFSPLLKLPFRNNTEQGRAKMN